MTSTEFYQGAKSVINDLVNNIAKRHYHGEQHVRDDYYKIILALSGLIRVKILLDAPTDVSAETYLKIVEIDNTFRPNTFTHPDSVKCYTELEKVIATFPQPKDKVLFRYQVNLHLARLKQIIETNRNNSSIDEITKLISDRQIYLRIQDTKSEKRIIENKLTSKRVDRGVSTNIQAVNRRSKIDKLSHKAREIIAVEKLVVENAQLTDRFNEMLNKIPVEEAIYLTV
jgi:hypothetical protein